MGVANIGETDINNKMEGYVEIYKNPVSGDEMYIYLEVSENVWYYFGYKEGQMGLISSDQPFNDLLTAKADKQKKSKEYSVIPVDFAEAKLFQKRFLETYRGIKLQPKPKTAPTTAKDKKVAEAAKDPAKKDEKKKKAEDEKEGF